MNETYERLYTEQQIAAALEIAKENYGSWGKMDHPAGTRHQFKPGLQKYIDGALGEIVFADHVGLTPNGRDYYNIGDVGIYQIKATRCTNDEINLIVPRNQAVTYKQSPFVLVQLFDCHYKIRGWTWGHQIPVKSHWLQENGDTSGGAYWVTTGQLQHMDDLPTV